VTQLQFNVMLICEVVIVGCVLVSGLMVHAHFKRVTKDARERLSRMTRPLAQEDGRK